MSFKNSPPVSRIHLLQTIWESLYRSNEDIRQVVERFFHPSYEQCINGISCNRAQYIEHVLEQKRHLQIDTFQYQHFLEKDNELFAIYYPKGHNTQHQPLEAEVIAYIRFEAQQIIHIHGQVRLVKGNLADADMQHSSIIQPEI